MGNWDINGYSCITTQKFVSLGKSVSRNPALMPEPWNMGDKQKTEVFHGVIKKKGDNQTND